MSRHALPLLIATLAALSAGLPAAAQSAEDQPYECADGTTLAVRFGETDAELVLPDGSRAALKFMGGDAEPAFSDGKRTITVKGDAIDYAVGKKAPLSCRMTGVMAPFDEPVTIDDVALESDPANPETERRVSCYRYPGFAVKEVDYGEKGAAKLALVAKDAACQVDDPAERVFAEWEGYFLGVRGNVVFLTASDGWNGGMPFAAFDAATLAKLFEDSFAGDTIEEIDDKNGLTLTFSRAYTADCSLYLDGGKCAETIRKAVPGLGTVADMPDCGPAYDEEKKRTPDYAAEVEQAPSVIIHKARLVWDGKTAKVEAVAGPTSCRVPS